MPRPGKFYVKTNLQRPGRNPCGIEYGNCSKQVVEIENHGGSHEDVYVEASSVHQEAEFVNSNFGSQYSICYVVPIQSGDHDTLELEIKQDVNNPVRATDTLQIEVQYQASRKNSKDQMQSIPGSTNLVCNLSSRVDLDTNP